MNRDLKLVKGGKYDPSKEIPSWAKIRGDYLNASPVRAEQAAEKETLKREQEKEQHNEGEAA